MNLSLLPDSIPHNLVVSLFFDMGYKSESDIIQTLCSLVTEKKLFAFYKAVHTEMEMAADGEALLSRDFTPENFVKYLTKKPKHFEHFDGFKDLKVERLVCIEGLDGVNDIYMVSTEKLRLKVRLLRKLFYDKQSILKLLNIHQGIEANGIEANGIVGMNTLYPSIKKVQGDSLTYIVPVLESFVESNGRRPDPIELWELLIKDQRLKCNFTVKGSGQNASIEGFGRVKVGEYTKKNLSDSLARWQKPNKTF